MDRVIFLIDMNSYFASVEQAGNPALRGKPIAVCGEGRTVVTTASYEARAFGVKTGMSLPEARRLCPQLMPVIGNLGKYADVSRRIHRILLQFTDQVEVYSIDECYLDITSLVRAGREPSGIAREIKRQIHETLGLLCSIGIGPNKVVAKIASKLQKPDGLVEIRLADVERVFAALPIESLQGVGVGRKTAAALKSLGLRTAADVGAAPESLLRRHFGIMGYYLKNVGRGIDGSPVKQYDEYEEAKSFGHSHTLPRDTFDLAVVRSYLRMLCEKAAARMRRDGFCGRTVHLVLRYADFTNVGRQRIFSHDISSGYDLYRAADAVLSDLLPFPKAVRLVGVTIGGLSRAGNEGFLLEDMEKQRRLIAVVDGLNRKYGSMTVKPSSILIADNFGMEIRCGMMGKYWLK